VRHPHEPRPSGRGLRGWAPMEALDETATQALHRITSYDVYDASDPDAIWAVPASTPTAGAVVVGRSRGSGRVGRSSA